MHRFPRLPLEFYLRPDVVGIARDLIGKVLVSDFDGKRTAGIITETEAYRAPDDRACHAWNNRRTPRTEVMFHRGGRAYIYLCYGIHHLFNVVTGPENEAHAVLIRALEPLEGIEWMQARRRLQLRKPADLPRLTTGPGALAQALGLHKDFSGQDFFTPNPPFWIEDSGALLPPEAISAGPRIGVEYAGACATRPWRFWRSDSSFVKKA
jgi:DNA-3-methyladenine glycosylase